MLHFERRAAADGLPVIGIDEAGRGPLAGSVVASAVHAPLSLLECLAPGAWRGVTDSKKLSPKRREALADAIKSTPGVFWATGEASPAEIDELNILRATHLAMRRAALNLAAKMAPADRFFILVDGLAVPSLPFPSQNIVKGDSKSLLVAAASIIAKTTRDAECLALDLRYPRYGFAVHKGYPTKAHLAALAEYGPSPVHRKSFAPVANAICKPQPAN